MKLGLALVIATTGLTACGVFPNKVASDLHGTPHKDAPDSAKMPGQGDQPGASANPTNTSGTKTQNDYFLMTCDRLFFYGVNKATGRGTVAVNFWATAGINMDAGYKVVLKDLSSGNAREVSIPNAIGQNQGLAVFPDVEIGRDFEVTCQGSATFGGVTSEAVPSTLNGRLDSTDSDSPLLGCYGSFPDDAKLLRIPPAANGIVSVDIFRDGVKVGSTGDTTFTDALQREHEWHEYRCVAKMADGTEHEGAYVLKRNSDYVSDYR